jgi:cyclopropane fatty-acyl-phospholipid synthase-like methyltransferase
MKKRKKIDSKEVGLDVGLMVFQFFLKTEYLHYGYFTPDLKIDVINLKKAQEQYFDYLVKHIPTGTKTILDVGCGSGKTAEELIKLGYKVDCVSPGKILTEHASKKLKGKVEMFSCKYEDVETDKKYDLILFSESFQYIPIKDSMSKAISMLNPGGHIIVCDFFKKDVPEKSWLGGGHSYKNWLEQLNEYPVMILTEEDITENTAPTIDLANDLNQQVVKPIATNVGLLAEDRFPWIVKLLRWKYKKKLEKMRHKHFSNTVTGEHFKKHKKYMFYLLQLKDS